MGKRQLTLSIGAANVALAEYEAGARGALTLVKYGIAPLAAPLESGSAAAVLGTALSDLVRGHGFRPGPVALAIPGQMVFPKFAAVPATGGGEKLEQLVRYEIEQTIPFPIDEMVCDRQVLGETENGETSVMIVAAKTDQVEEITTAVSNAGFSPTLVDVAPIALVNAFRRSYPDDGSCVILLDIGAKTTSLVIAEGEKLYNRSVPVAGQHITKEIAAALGCSPEEADRLKCEKGYVSLGGVTEDEDEVADRISKVCRTAMTRLNAEIVRSINFYRSQQNGSAPVRLFLTGGSALLPQMDAFFADALGVEVVFFNPFESVGLGRGVDAAALETDAAFLGVTAGVAGHLAGAVPFAINLLPPSILEARAERAKIPFVILGGLGILAALSVTILAINRETAVLAAQREAIQGVADRLANDDRKVVKAESDVAAAQEEAESLRQLLTGRTAAVRHLAAVRSSLESGMWLERWDAGRVVVRYWKDVVHTVSGKTPGERVVERLKGKPCVDAQRVKISDMSAIGKEGQVQQFTVEVSFK